MANLLGPDPLQGPFFIPGSNTPGNGVKLFTYVAGTTTKTTVYKTLAGVAHNNPIVLDSGGSLPGGSQLWIPSGVTIKAVYAPSNDTDPPGSPYLTLDNLSGAAGASSLSSEWVSGPTPTYVSGTSFTLVGDQTATFQVGRRVKTTNTSGTIYSTINSSAFTTLTTVTVANDSGVLDGGLSAVSYGLISAVSTSDPAFIWPVLYGGSGDATAAVTAAIAALPSNGVLVFKAGQNFNISTVSCNGKAITIWAYGATITYTSASGAFSKTDHGFKLTVLGGTFVASGATSIAIKYNATPTTNTYDDFLIRDCDFTNGTNAYALSIVGAREGNIQRCTFRGNATGGGAVYLQASVSPFIESCQFIGGAYAGTAVFYDGTGTGYDAGLVLHNCEIMGWDTGVDVRYCDWLNIYGCTIDYNEVNGIVLYSQDGAVIEGNYLGSLNATPAVQISKGALAAAPDYNDKIKIANNYFTGHYTGGNTYDNILINDNDCSRISISNNSFDFYTRYAINFKTLEVILINNNTFAPRSGFGVLPIFNSTGAGDSSVRIRGNNFPAGTVNTSSGLAFCKMRDNVGYVTNDEGSYIASGTTTAYTIAHGMSATPDHVQLTPGINLNIWLASLTSTNIVANVSATSAAFSIYWTAAKMRGF